MKYDKLRDNLIDIFNSMNYGFKMYDVAGKVQSNPYEARYFFVDNPNIMLIVDDETNTLEFHRANFSFNTFKQLLNMIRNVTSSYFIKLHVSTYNNTITPKTFTRDVLRRKSNKIIQLAENLEKSLDVKETQNIIQDMVIESLLREEITMGLADDLMFILENRQLGSQRADAVIGQFLKQREK